MSNETKWTPGEWDVDFLAGSERYAVRSKSKYHIATMFKSAHMADGEDEANARLIAASPSLAEYAIQQAKTGCRDAIAALQGVLANETE